METANAFNFAPSSSSSDDLRALQEELEQLNSDLTEANEQRVQAAEYGLVLLEQKQTLNHQHEVLKGLYETTKRELDSSVNVSKSVTTCVCGVGGGEGCGMERGRVGDMRGRGVVAWKEGA